MSNTAWAYAKLAYRKDALMKTGLQESFRRVKGFVSETVGEESQEAYALIWALWRTYCQQDLGNAMLRCMLSGVFSDALVQGILLMDYEWRALAGAERSLEVALGSGLPQSALRTLWLRGQDHRFPAGAAFETMYHMYRKLSRLLDYMADKAPHLSTTSEVLWHIESFGHVGQWLKVAGGVKALVTERALMERAPGLHETCAEFGAFVGYSGIRYARCVLCQSGTLRPLCIVSFEVDPVHASVARHLIDRAGVSAAAEVALGQLQDTVGCVAEFAGGHAEAFVFMDQRGTTFHEDLFQLERLHFLAAHPRVTADNVEKPGAPVFLWHTTRSQAYATVLWSMAEFASDSIEDWQSDSSGICQPTLLPASKCHYFMQRC
eukprot:gnl/MRDRNA2_/MRDRNA2_85622_c0_seq1.p1 gnl/MRDRNA2_/MRDRNA2_85622_c0~~gnl/MRDRNA2_/MRDRNA2_85622_c0_seq1.p1  ORF type:complete len:377 (+),score=58.81 gnl/MRDRNA2_/MRDRNA2_85622_c0_seq1:16-1146(+)